MLNYFKVVLTVQFFYAVGISMLLCALTGVSCSVTGFPPGASEAALNLFQNLPNTNIKELQQKTEGTLSNQTGFPQANIGSLVFFSGFVLVDLLANFVLAVPSMFSILLQVIFMFMPVDPFLQAQVVVFGTGIIALIYIVGLLSLFTSVSTGRTIS